MSRVRPLSRAIFAAVVALGGPITAADPSPRPAGCPSIGSEDRTPVAGPTAFRLGQGVEQPIDVADDGRGDARGVTIRFRVRTDATGTPTPPAVPTLRWSVDGGDWHLVTLLGSGPRQWSSTPSPAPAIRPRAYRTLRVWVAFHVPSAPGEFTVDTMFDSPTCGRVGSGRDVTFAYDPRGLPHPTEVTPGPATAPPSAAGSVPVLLRPAVAGRSPLVFRAVGTAVAVVLAVAGLVVWRRARRESRPDG